MNLKDTAIIGLDLSLNAAGLVIMDWEGKIRNTMFITSIKKFADAKLANFGAHIYYLQPKLGATKQREAEDNDLFTARRRYFMSSAIIDFIVNQCTLKPSLVCLEGYAYDTKSTGLFEMAEVAGVIKNRLWLKNIPLRIHDPLSVKIWATGNAFAKKIHMMWAARKDFETPACLVGLGSKFQFPIEIDGIHHTHDMIGPGTDLTDAYYLAMMGRIELYVRSGLMSLQELSEGQRKVFLRTTKAHPINLLDRAFIERKEESIQ